MNDRIRFSVRVSTVIVPCLAVAVCGGEPAPENFIYQGQLKQNGVPVNGDCDFKFSLFRDGQLVGEQSFLADPEMPNALPVVDGLFQAELDFGDLITAGGAYSMEIAARCPAGVLAPMTILSPPVPINPAPLAYHAKTVEKPDGHSLDASDGSPGNAVYVDEQGFVGIGTSNPQSVLHLIRNAEQIGLKLKAGASWTAELRQTNSSVLSLINSSQERLSIAPDGNVGIGTTSPSSRLDVISGADPQLEVRTADESGDDAGIIIQGARNGSTNVDAAYIDFRNFDSDEGATGTEYSTAKIGAGMQTVSGQTGFLRLWTNDGAGLEERMRIASDGNVGIGTTSPDSLLHLSSAGPLTLKLEADTNNVNETDNANLRLSQDGGLTTSRIGYANGSNIFEITQEQANKVHIGVDNRTVVEVGATTLEVNNLAGNRIATIGQTASGDGVLELYGPTGSINVLVSQYGAERGVVQIYDENGSAQAGMYINDSGQGVVFGDSKQFRVPNPADPETDICYASLEGPEAAAYVRGTASLVNGEAVIELPEHFRTIASPRGLTVNVTPLSADSAGLAVVQKSSGRVVVRELNRGSGNYDFDYMVTAVRKGHESFKVIQPTRRRPAAAGSSAAARAQRDVEHTSD